MLDRESPDVAQKVVLLQEFLLWNEQLEHLLVVRRLSISQLRRSLHVTLLRFIYHMGEMAHNLEAFGNSLSHSFFGIYKILDLYFI